MLKMVPCIILTSFTSSLIRAMNQDRESNKTLWKIPLKTLKLLKFYFTFIKFWQTFRLSNKTRSWDQAEREGERIVTAEWSWQTELPSCLSLFCYSSLLRSSLWLGLPQHWQTLTMYLGHLRDVFSNNRKRISPGLLQSNSRNSGDACPSEQCYQ